MNQQSSRKRERYLVWLAMVAVILTHRSMQEQSLVTMPSWGKCNVSAAANASQPEKAGSAGKENDRAVTGRSET